MSAEAAAAERAPERQMNRNSVSFGRPCLLDLPDEIGIDLHRRDSPATTAWISRSTAGTPTKAHSGPVRTSTSTAFGLAVSRS